MTRHRSSSRSLHLRSNRGAAPAPGLRPSATLHRSIPYGPSPRRRLARGGTGAGALAIAVTGLGAALAAATATAAPQPGPARAAATTAGPSATTATGLRLGGAVHGDLLAAGAPRAASRTDLRRPLAPPTVARPATAPASPAALGPSVTGLASWYGPGFDGRLTASGTRYDENAMTAASRTLPLGTHLRVCRDGTCVIVLINDWGPVPRSRMLDLSRAAATRLGLISAGVGEVTATPVA